MCVFSGVLGDLLGVGNLVMGWKGWCWREAGMLVDVA